MSEEEKKAIETLKEVASDDFDTLGDDISPKMAQNILNFIKNLQEEIEEKTTIIMAGAEKVKQLEKEIILLKIEKLKALKQYKECDLSQIPDTANIYYSMKLELEAIDEEISNLMRIWENLLEEK